MSNSHLPGNPYRERAAYESDPLWATYFATLALAWEQRQRNTLAYRTAEKRGINLEGLDHLKGESND